MAELNAIIVCDWVARLVIDAEPHKHKVVGEDTLPHPLFRRVICVHY